MDATLVDIPTSRAIYEAALEGLVRINATLYQRDPSLPSIYDAGVRYRREAGELWRPVTTVLRELWGDCDDLAAAVAGYQRARLGDPRSRVTVRKTGPKYWHCLVRQGDGKVLDPSRDLGMGTAEGDMVMERNDSLAGDWEDWKVIGADPMERNDSLAGDWEVLGADPVGSAELTWTAERTKSGWRGTVRVPLDLGRMLLVSSHHPNNKARAVTSALSRAGKLLDNPAVASIIPPQARFALRLAKSRKARKIAKALGHLF